MIEAAKYGCLPLCRCHSGAGGLGAASELLEPARLLEHGGVLTLQAGQVAQDGLGREEAGSC